MCCAQIGIIPYAGVDIATFELMKQHLLEKYHGDPHPVSILAAGMLSSSVAQFASYPLSLVRTRLQVGDAAAPDGPFLPIGGYQPCKLLRWGQALWLLTGPPAPRWPSLSLAPCRWCDAQLQVSAAPAVGFWLPCLRQERAICGLPAQQ